MGRRGMGGDSKRLAGGGRVALEGLGQEVLAGVVGVGKGPFGGGVGSIPAEHPRCTH
jgi:hypothetical protein